MNETLSGPEVRVRIKHTATTKGWRLDETTVEITYHSSPAYGINDAHQLLGAELYAAYEDGRDEAIRRNAQEGRTEDRLSRSP